MSVNKVKALLPTLSAAELRDVRAGVQSLLSLAPAEPESDLDTDQFQVLAAVTEVLRSLGAEQVSVPVLKMAAVRDRSLPGKVRDLMAYIHDGHPSKSGRAALLRLGIQLLYEDMTSRRNAVSARTILANIHRVPAVLNKAFPNYAKAGLLGWVVDPPRAAAE